MEAVVNGETPDRPPVALWRHFPVDDQQPQSLADVHLHFQHTFDFDFLKVTPASGYFVYDWGVEDAWKGSPEGTREYIKRVVKKPEDWEVLPLLNPHKGHLGDQLKALTTITETLGPDVPVIQTIFSPLSVAKKLVGDDQLIYHMRQYPEQFLRGLQLITECCKDFVDAVIHETGVAGIFYAVQHAQSSLLTPDEYLDYGRTYDLPILEAAADGWLNVLHLHGDNIYFDQFIDYPVQVVNWHDLETKPDLAGGLAKFPGAVCGGLRQHDTVNLGTPEMIRQEAQTAIDRTGGNRFILGTGCVAMTTTPYGNLKAARKVVEE
jgi:uroporphyrinogen decarboxylase